MPTPKPIAISGRNRGRKPLVLRSTPLNVGCWFWATS